MEGKEDTHSSGLTKGEEVPASCPAAANLFSGSATPPVPVPPVSAPAAGAENASQISGSATATALVSVTPAGSTEGKKKRGRPRKYGPDGKPRLALSPMPISASIPLTGGDYSGWKNGSGGRPVDSFKKKHKLEFGSPGEHLAFSIGASFTPHVITVNAGEDVSMKIISFSQQGSRAICILAANGSISNVTLRQPNSSGGTLTYEGRFEILSLSGSFTPTDNGVTKSRSGGMSVSLAGPDGRVLGGGLAGLLVAAGPVQVVIASFLPSHQHEQKPKKQRVEHAPTFSPIPVYPISSEVTDAPAYSVPKPNAAPVSSFHGENLASPISTHGPKIMGAENNISFPGAESKDLSSSKFEVSC